ncbi:MAG: hypothetical protein J6Z49_06065 [Kiritimatiellae bacterium]|nr:hypothetical protein [Kiritimatiellia bacterium]
MTISNNITGTSFDASWSAVDGATGYKVYVWTNAVVGASAGTAVWQETMPGATNDANNTVLNDNKFAACFANPGWTRLGKAGYPTGENGTIRIGTASETGWIQTPQINYAADGMALRFFAKANATNTKSMDIAIERVSGGVATLAGTATLTTEMQDFTIVLPDWGSGDCIRFNSITNGDKRTIIGSVAVVSGYSDGSVTPLYIVDGLDVGSATSHSFTGFPSVPVQFGVEAYGRHGISSATSETIEVDLANPDKVAILNACPLSSLAGTANTYSQSFDSLSAITATTGNKDLLNGTTILYWQFYKGSDAANSIKHNSGTGNTGGLYALAANLDLPERALGAYSTRNDEFSFGIAFTNDTDRTIVLSSIAYSAQQWGFNNTTNQTLSVSVKVVDGLDWISAYGDGWMELNSTKSAVYGSGDTHDTPVSTPVMVDPQEEIAIASGQVLMLKWTVHSLKSGTAGMMGIDDVSMTFAVQRSKNALVIRLAGNTEK